jgi:hypothetical protein
MFNDEYKPKTWELILMAAGAINVFIYYIDKFIGG